jgi:hypothetical protein
LFALFCATNDSQIEKPELALDEEVRASESARVRKTKHFR